MRKGRSQRKTRGSLPPLSSRSHTSLGAGPQVVIGLTNPPRNGGDDGASSESTDRSPEHLETRSARGAEAAPALDLVREAERLELIREQSLEIVRESLELVRESLATEAEAPVAEAPVSQAPVSEAPILVEAAPASIDIDVAQADQAEQAEEFAQPEALAQPEPPAFELIESEPPPAAVRMHTTALPTPDEISIPPMGDLSVEPVAERFFSEGELVAAGGLEAEEDSWDTAADKGQRKSLPHVVERRARFAKYVRWAVGGAAVVCLAALARTAIMPAKRVPAPAAAAVTALEAPAAKAASPAVTAAAIVEAPKVDVPKAPEPAAEPAAAAPAPAPAAETAAAPAAVATGDKTALEEKNDARRALERGKTADAIEAGERSVALDPTDGEAWLLLGAAYQDKGKGVEARRCYTACIKEGKRGPLGECRAMLRY